ncbi:hypothetical protein M124_0716 [Bacteroides fragilis str. 3988T(B)14]|uniref:Uncharacterized protein n=1 Tax=Bacteroides fragilis str. 3988T(B)14 TaxID=1339315 RepID=A0A015STH3_BACFG|nr:hypothetical protein M124_0716 [Bacteroides fragilis str. 3988T(B)14]
MFCLQRTSLLNTKHFFFANKKKHPENRINNVNERGDHNL